MRSGNWLSRAMLTAAGLFLCGAGLLMVFMPGPGIALILVGCEFIARESRAASRFLDRSELWFRRLVRRRGCPTGDRPGRGQNYKDADKNYKPDR